MKKFILVLLLLVLVSGCSSKKENKSDIPNLTESEQKVIEVLEDEYNGFKCDGTSCDKKEIYDDEEYWYHVIFPIKQYEFLYKTKETINGVEQESKIRYIYNWGMDYLEAEATMKGYHNNKIYIVIDEKGDFGCDSSNTNECYALKSGLLESKIDFLELVSKAHIKLDDIK